MIVSLQQVKGKTIFQHTKKIIMKTYGFYLNAEKLIFTGQFENLTTASEYCKNNYTNYWCIEIKKI